MFYNKQALITCIYLIYNDKVKLKLLLLSFLALISFSFATTIGGTINVSTVLPGSALKIELWTVSPYAYYDEIANRPPNSAYFFGEGTIDPDRYFVKCQDVNNVYFPMWYNNAWGYSDRATVDITVSNQNSINFYLYPRYVVSGKVVNASGTGIAGVTVAAFKKYSSYTWINSVTTNASGDYSLPVPGDNNLMLQATYPGYFTTFYSGTSTAAYGEDTAATVNLSSSVSGYRVTMNTVSTINGTVRNSSGTGLGSVEVYAFERSASFNYINKVTTAGDGTYTLTVPSNVNLMLRSTRTGYTTTYYNQELFNWANSVTINLSSTTTTNKDFTLYTARSISGTVTANPSGTALSGVEIDLFTSQNVYVTNALTNASGQYTLTNIPDNDGYFIQATANGYYAQWHNRAYGYGDRTTLNLAGADRTNINFALYSAGTISGTMKDAQNNNLSGVRVTAYVKGSNYTYITNTTANAGTYSLSIPVGASVNLQASTTNQFLGYPNGTWYGNTDTSVNAVTFTASSTNINFVLDSRWIVSGNVQPAGTLVEVFGWKNWSQYYGSVTSNASGYYTISGTGNANFPVMIRYSTGNYVTEIYNDKNNYNNLVTTNDQITVNIGTTTNVSAQTLALGGTITGTVSGAGAGTITINIEDANGVYFTEVTTNGSYSVARVPAGAWKVKAIRSGAVTEYYGGTTTTASATTINLSSGGTSSNINIVLDAALSVSGRVSNNSGAALQNSRVVLFTTGNVYVAETLSAANGSYTFNNVIPGGYFVMATANSYFDQWYNGGYGYADRTTINLTATTANINFTLYAIGTISGRVSDSAGVGLSGVRITAYVKGSNYTYITNTTANAGAYSISIPVGATFNLQATTTNQFLGEDQGPGLYGIWYNGQAASVSATQFTASSTNINFVLTNRWIVSGNVQPAGTLVEVFGWKNWSQHYGSVTSNASGYYTISGTGNANFPVMIRYSTGNYVTEIYNDKNNYNNLVTTNDQITVNIGTTTNVSAQTLALGGTITGTVSGAGAGTITINIEDANGVYFTEVTTNGSYSVARVPAGAWKVKAIRSGAVTEYYGGTTTTASATTINLSSGGTSSNINIVLDAALSVSGRVSNNSGAALQNSRVVLFTTGNVYVAETLSAANGSYTFNNVIPGGYFVMATANSYFDQWYNGGYGYADRTTINLAASTANINFTLYAIGTISGRVSDSAGVGLSGVRITAYVKGSNYTYITNTTANAGAYSISIPIGATFNLQATTTNQFLGEDQGPGLYGIWYNGQALSVSATQFTGSSTNINFVLTNRWIVSGNVQPAGTLVEVFGWKNWSQYYGSVTSNASGYYTLSGTGNANFPVMIRYSTGNYVTEIYNDKNNYNNLVTTNDQITVNIGTTTNVSAQTLALGGTIAGTITAAGGSGIITVNIEDVNGNYFTAVTTNGAFSVSRLPAGSWKVRATRSGCVSEYYGERAGTANATTINLTSGQTTSNINIGIGPEWTISGIVHKRDGSALSGALVQAYFYNGNWEFVSQAYTTATGSYTIHDGYNNAQVFIKVSAASYLDTFYNGESAGYPTADAITVTVNGAVTGINVTMNGFATLTGTVHDDAGSVVANADIKVFDKNGSFTYRSGATTNVSGLYSVVIPDATAVMLKVEKSGYQDIFYVSANNWQAAATLNLINGATSSNINVTINRQWTITGSIVMGDSSVPSDSFVEVFAWKNFSQYIGSTYVNATGMFSMTGTGNNNTPIMVRVSKPGYVTMFYKNKYTVNELVTANDQVTINLMQTTGLQTVTLNRAGSISGMITAQGGSGAITVNIEDANGTYFTSITTNGSYALTGIPVGQWKVKALRSGCVAEYFGETASTLNATTVNVVAGATVNNVNITIAPAWTISGNVSILGGGIAAGVLVEAYVYAAGWQYIDSATTNALGNYIIDQGYNTQNIFIRATSTNYSALFYNNVYGDWTDADMVSMYPGLATTNINFVIYRNGSITGVVSNNAGLGLSGVTVTAYLASDHSWVAETNTNAVGRYTLSVLPGNGLYIVASTNAHIVQLYNGIDGANKWASGNVVTVNSGGTSANINFALTPYWSVGGRVRLSDSAAIPAGTLVYLYDSSNTANLVTTISVASAGQFSYTSTADVSLNVLVLVGLDGYSTATTNIRIKCGDATTITANLQLYLVADIEPVPAGQTVKDTIKSGPNPANPEKEPIHIGMILDKDSHVSVRVYTLGGEKVYENTKNFGPGYNEFLWNGEDLFSDKIPNGVYIAYIEVDTGDEKIRKVLKIAVLK